MDCKEWCRSQNLWICDSTLIKKINPVTFKKPSTESIGFKRILQNKWRFSIVGNTCSANKAITICWSLYADDVLLYYCRWRCNSSQTWICFQTLMSFCSADLVEQIQPCLDCGTYFIKILGNGMSFSSVTRMHSVIWKTHPN